MKTRVWRILLAEDNYADVMLIEEALKRRSIDYELDHYTTAPEAKEAVHQAGAGDHPVPDLILLDFNLPGGHGLAILTAAAGNPHLAGVPKAVLSSFIRPSELAELSKLGASCVLLKPPELNAFLTQIGKGIEDLLTEGASKSAG